MRHLAVRVSEKIEPIYGTVTVKRGFAKMQKGGVIMDVTNAVRYWDEWEVLFNTMMKIRAEGKKVPQFCFWAFNGPVISVVQDLYDWFYKNPQYEDLWFYWDGKPLLLYNGHASEDAINQVVMNPNPHYDPARAGEASAPIQVVDAFLEKMSKEPERFEADLRRLGRKFGSVLLPKSQVAAMRQKAAEMQDLLAGLGV